jgi:hypothetical protein
MKRNNKSKSPHDAPGTVAIYSQSRRLQGPTRSTAGTECNPFCSSSSFLCTVSRCAARTLATQLRPRHTFCSARCDQLERQHAECVRSPRGLAKRMHPCVCKSVGGCVGACVRACVCVCVCARARVRGLVSAGASVGVSGARHKTQGGAEET